MIFVYCYIPFRGNVQKYKGKISGNFLLDLLCNSVLLFPWLMGLFLEKFLMIVHDLNNAFPLILFIFFVFQSDSDKVSKLLQ